MGRKRAFSWRTLAALVLLSCSVRGMARWQSRHWAPPRDGFRQGVLFARARASGFRALRASAPICLFTQRQRAGRDARFAANIQAVRDSGLSFGAVHAYDPCVPAERQAANFVTIVPRDATLLPPAIALEKLADGCPDPVSEAAVESELTTFLNQVEGHVGKPAVLKVAPGFEARYHIAGRIERNLWLERDWWQPDYAGRPWTLWTPCSRSTRRECRCVGRAQP